MYQIIDANLRSFTQERLDTILTYIQWRYDIWGVPEEVTCFVSGRWRNQQVPPLIMYQYFMKPKP